MLYERPLHATHVFHLTKTNCAVDMEDHFMWLTLFQFYGTSPAVHSQTDIRLLDGEFIFNSFSHCLRLFGGRWHHQLQRNVKVQQHIQL